jgi:Family of unknown function (DUF6152)
MTHLLQGGRVRGILLALLLAGAGIGAADAHHSFAMYDQTKTVVMTGVTNQYVAQANHAELHFYVIGPDGKLLKDAEGKNISWGVEMAGAAAVARQGITAESFPAGTIFSVKINPLRDGTNFGSRVGDSAIAKCPWKTPPAPGKSCDTVKGSELLGADKF